MRRLPSPGRPTATSRASRCRSRAIAAAAGRQVRRRHGVHAAQPHGAADAPPRPRPCTKAFARRRTASPTASSCHAEQGDGRVTGSKDAFCVRLPPLRRGQARLLRMPLRPQAQSLASVLKPDPLRVAASLASVAPAGGPGRGTDERRRPSPAAGSRLGCGDGRASRSRPASRCSTSRRRARPPRPRRPRCAGACWSTSTAARPTATPASSPATRRTACRAPRPPTALAVDPQGRVEGHARRDHVRCR